MKKSFTTAAICILYSLILYGQGITIQENEIGFCSVDGIIDTDVPGYTGDGFANADIAAGTSALWNIDVNEDDTYKMYWRYANGGGSGDLFAEVWINEVPVITDLSFDHTEEWTNWTESDTVTVQLDAGENRIRLVSLSPSGLPNIDFFHVINDGVTPAYCPPSYSFKLSKNIDAGGTISYSPVQQFYDAGTEITLEASANDGYFFQSWSGGTTGVEPSYTFRIDRNADVEALFYPDGTVAENGVMGYATVQDDEGTPYLMTGGLFGDTVKATSFATLKAFLEHDNPYVVTVADHITSTGTINITSDKTLLGISDSAHLEGIRIKINDADNVILRNMTFSKVVQFDEIEINESHHIWIDGCEFFTDRDNGQEYYDGLLDIKNAASFITISNTHFHDHFKAILISSGDDSFQDTSIRITFYHNFFENLNSRTPLLRFGRAHIFNNYFKKCNSGINSRMGACMRVEENYFYRVGNAVRTDMSIVEGYFHLIDNIFERSGYIPPPTCELDIPYEYLSFMIPAEEVPLSAAGEDPLVSTSDINLEPEVSLFPNPAGSNAKVSITTSSTGTGSLRLYNAVGVEMHLNQKIKLHAGTNNFQLDLEGLNGGMYYLRILLDESSLILPLIIQ